MYDYHGSTNGQAQEGSTTMATTGQVHITTMATSIFEPTRATMASNWRGAHDHSSSNNGQAHGSATKIATACPGMTMVATMAKSMANIGAKVMVLTATLLVETWLNSRSTDFKHL